MQAAFLSRAIPYLLAISGLYLLTFLFFQPEILENKALSIDDSRKGAQMGREISEHRQATGEPTLWTGTMFGGMPATMISLQEYFSPLDWFNRIKQGIFLPYTAGYFFSYLLCTFILLLCFGARPYWAMAGAMAFGLTTYNLIIVEVGHLWKVSAIAAAGLVLGGIRLTFRGKRLEGFALAAIGTALELKANHAQITYYFFFIVLVYALTELIFAAKENRLPAFGKSVAVLLLAGVLGVSTSVGRLWSMWEYNQHSNRGKVLLAPISEDAQQVGESGVGTKSYAFGWSQGIGETGTLLIPYLYGGSSQEPLRTDSEMYRAVRGSEMPQNQKNYLLYNAPLYFGNQPFTAGPVYAGAVICFLFVLGLFVLDASTRVWLLGGVLLLTMIAWGSNFASLNYLLFDYFPLFNKFRAVAMSLSLVILLMVLGAFLGTERLTEAKGPSLSLRDLLIAFGLTGGVSLLVFLMSGTMNVSPAGEAERFGAALSELLQGERRGLVRSDALRSFALITLAATAVYLFLKEKIKATVLLAILGVLAVGDLWQVGKRYLNHDDFTRQNRQTLAVATPTPADKRILGDTSRHYRILPLYNPFNDSEEAALHKTIGGYSPAKLRRYQDFIERRLSLEMQALVGRLQQGERPEFEKLKGINMLNTRYFKAGTAPEQVIQNPSPYGVAWFVEETKAVPGHDAEMAAIGGVTQQQPSFSLTAGEDLRRVAVFNAEDTPLQAQTYFKDDSLQSVALIEYRPNGLRYRINTPQKAFVVFSEVYYPVGWEVRLNGEKVDFQKVNYLLRGLEVPAGTHELVCEFLPESYYLGMQISQIAGFILFGFLILTLFWRIKYPNA